MIFIIKFFEAYNRSSVKEFLYHSDNSQLQLLKIEDASLLIRRENQEIIYAGNRYDVKMEFSNKGVIYFYCINDKEEENIYDALKTSLNSQSDMQKGKHNQSTNKILKHIIQDYYLQDRMLKIPDGNLSQEIISSTSAFLINIFFSVVTPPPKGILS